jgi:hypothetical protein
MASRISFGQRRLRFGCASLSATASSRARAFSLADSALNDALNFLASTLACLADFRARLAGLLLAASLRACFAALARSLRVCLAFFASLRRARRVVFTTS